MKYKILIIEDDVDIGTLLKEYLDKYNLDARIVKDFDNVMTDFEEYEPNIVLLDINLPKFDGFY